MIDNEAKWSRQYYDGNFGQYCLGLTMFSNQIFGKH